MESDAAHDVKAFTLIRTTARQRCFATLLLLAIAGVFAWMARSREPVFEGRPLSFWLIELQASGSETDEDGRAAARRVEAATRAIRSIGPAAAPELLRRIEQRDSRVRAFVGEWLNKLPSSTFDPRPRQRERPLAAWAFVILGPAGLNAVPRLIELTGDRIAGQEAMQALAGIGAPAVPALRKQLSSKDAAEQERAIILLGHIGPGAIAAIPELFTIFTNAPPAGAKQALLALAFIGSERPRTIALAAANLLATNSVDYAAMTLAALGRDGLPFLLKGLTNAEPEIRQAAVIGLRFADYFMRSQSANDVESQHALRSNLERSYRLSAGNTRMAFQGGYGERRIATALTNLHRAFSASNRALAAKLMAQLPEQGEIVRLSLEGLTGDLDPEVRAAARDGLWQLGPAPPPATNAPAPPPAGRGRRRGMAPQ